ncbi:MAG: glycosyltransferase [Oscillatoriales cyanobacterium]|nr:MAG: glycosyltransferase [Oscillatoriales cyanobacterium]
MHLAVLFEFDPDRPTRDHWPAAKLGHWGRCLAMADAIERAGHRVTRIGGLDKTREQRSRRAKLRRRLYAWQHQHYLAWTEPRFNRDYAAQLAQQLTAKGHDGDKPHPPGNYDAIVTPDTNLVAYLKTNLPIFFWADTTYATLIDVYPGFCDLCQRSRRQLQDLDQRALKRCRRVLLASDWAIEGAASAYGLDRDRFRLIELGGNLEPPEAPTVQAHIEQRDRHRLNLLWIGTDWQRKGGDRAIELVHHLREQNIPAQLTTIGGQAPYPSDLIRNVGRLDPSQPADRTQLEAALNTAHFLVLPSEAECFGHVLCEANGFGVPVLTSDVGGIPSVVRSGVNGLIAPLAGWATAIAPPVVELWRDWSAYQALARSARREYETRLNWTTLGERVSAEIARSLAIGS